MNNFKKGYMKNLGIIIVVVILLGVIAYMIYEMSKAQTEKKQAEQKLQTVNEQGAQAAFNSAVSMVTGVEFKTATELAGRKSFGN